MQISVARLKETLNSMPDTDLLFVVWYEKWEAEVVAEEMFDSCNECNEIHEDNLIEITNKEWNDVCDSLSGEPCLDELSEAFNEHVVNLINRKGQPKCSKS